MGALRVFITGAGSYVGRAAADFAMRAGYEVVLHSRYGHRVSWSDVPEVIPVDGPLDGADMPGLLTGCAAVIHVAGRMTGTEEEFREDVVEDSAALMRAAAKAGVHGFTKALAQEGAAKGITVNAIAPGYIATEMVRAVPENVLEKIVARIPVRRLGEASEIARGVAFLVSDDAGFITGSTLSINGGQHMY